MAHSASSGPLHPTVPGQGQAVKLYKQFIDEASKLYADALVRDEAEISALVAVYALIGRMRVLSSSAVIEKAEAVVRMIVDTYFAPNKTFPELRDLINSRSMDPLRAFSEECRRELRNLDASATRGSVAKAIMNVPTILWTCESKPLAFRNFDNEHHSSSHLPTAVAFMDPLDRARA